MWTRSLALIVLLAGCADIDPAVAHAPTGQVTSPDLSAAHVDGIVSDGSDVAIDVLRLLDVDMEQVVLVQALGDGNVTYGEHRELMLDGRTDPLDESPDPTDRCIRVMHRLPAPGQDILADLDRDVGQDWPQARWSRSMHSSGGTGGRSGGAGPDAAHAMAAGEWLLLSWGTSGIDHGRLSQGDNVWRADLSFTMDHRIVVLPPLPLLCGAGFQRMDGANGPYFGSQASITLQGELGASVSVLTFDDLAAGTITVHSGDTDAEVSPGEWLQWSTDADDEVGLRTDAYAGEVHWVLHARHIPYLDPPGTAPETRG